MQSRNNNRNNNNNPNNNHKSNNGSGSYGKSGGSGGDYDKLIGKPSSVPAPTAPVAMLKRLVTNSSTPGQPAPAPAATSQEGKKVEAKRTIAVGDLFGKGKDVGNTTTMKDKHEYGVVLSLRAAFGFIQSIYTEESYYFSEKDFYHEIRVGDLVAFEVRNGPKGLAAFHVTLLSTNEIILLKDTKGTISRSHDRHRSNYGLIEVDNLTSLSLSELQKNTIQTRYQGSIPFHHTNIVRDTLPKNHFLDRGDYIQFSIITFPDTHFFIATDIRFIQLKRDRAIALQIERMLSAGAVREVGVISAVKNQEYGFIRAQDRKDELYFRIDDIENENNSAVKEGTEVEFFVIAEMIRGRLCERAIHLKIIPAGTVQFEVVVVSDANLTVLTEPGLPPADEIPGLGKLDEEISVEQYTGGSKIVEVDLWHRCMPEDLIVRKGDRLKVNIHYYRPEKIFFARNARIIQFFPLGRDIGQIVTIKEQNSFGFIKSDMRKVDLYFKSTLVINSNGEPVPESELKKGNIVTFDCNVEDALKLRAIRVQLADQATQQHYLTQVNSSSSASSSSVDDTVLLKDVVGVVVRNASKRDSQGLIKVANPVFKEIQELVFIDPLIVQAIDSHFLPNASLNSIDLPGLPDHQKKVYQDVIDHRYSSQLTYETLPTHVTDNFKTLRITKKAAVKDQVETPVKPEKALKILSKGDSTIPFSKEDYKTEELGPLISDMEVIFDVAWDRFKAKKVAKYIRLTDEEIPQTEEEKVNNVGVIDAFIQSSYRGGFIRSLKTDEKLFWVSKASEGKGGSDTVEEGNGTTNGDYAVDSEVSYTLRKRGGLRCAVDVKLLPKGTLSKEVVLPQVCNAVIVAQNTATNQFDVVLTETGHETQLCSKYIDLAVLDALFKLQQPPQSSSTAATSNETVVKADSPQGEGQGESSPNAEVGAALNGNDVPSSTEDRVEYKAKYYPPLARLPISTPARTMTPSNEASKEGEGTASPIDVLKLGDVVRCHVVVNWAVKRSPLSVTVLDILPSNAVKRRGRIQNAKFRIKTNVVNQVITSLSSSVSVDQLKRYRLNELDWTEIQEIPLEKKGATPLEDSLSLASKPVTAAVTFGTFYCLFNEIGDVSGNSNNNGHEFNRESLEVGEEVEFWTLPNNAHIAFGVVTVPKRDFGFGKAPAINDRLKTKVAGTNLISMAQGPPTDSAAGFEAGWKQVDAATISALPWASLLTHLQV